MLGSCSGTSSPGMHRGPVKNHIISTISAINSGAQDVNPAKDSKHSRHMVLAKHG